MAQITAEIDLSAISITGVQTVTVSTTDIYGVTLTIATLTQDFTGVSTTAFINLISAQVNSGASGFLAYNENPVLKLTRTVDVDLWVGQQVDLTFDVSNFNASWIKVGSASVGCSPCYTYDLFSCYGSYFIDVNLNPATPYNITLTDKFTHNYITSVTTDSEGAFSLSPTTFPTGFFTPSNGPLVMTITTTDNVLVTFTIGYVTYDCLTVNVENLTTV